MSLYFVRIGLVVALIQICGVSVGYAQARIDAYFVVKQMDFLQVSPATPSNQPIPGSMGGSAHFAGGLVGSNLDLLSPAPSLTLPNLSQFSLLGDSVSRGITVTYANKVALDASYPNGSYSFKAGAWTLPISLGTSDAYPTDIPRIANGSWDDQSRLVIDATTGGTLTFNNFSSYFDGVGGSVTFELYSFSNGVVGPQLVSESSVAMAGYGSQPLLSSVVLSPGLLQPGQTYYATIVFARIVDLDVSRYPMIGMAMFGNVTGFLISTVSTNSAPVFTTQPVSQTVTSGSSVTFAAAASGTPAPTYQWKKNGSEISGARSSAFTIGSAAPADGGSYIVVATNSAGSVTSVPAVLTIVVPVTPVFITQPVSQSVAAGNSVTFIAEASGAPAPTYQWYKNGMSVPSATNASFTLTNVNSGDAGIYQVVAVNSSGAAMSAGATLTVSVPPIFTTQPLSHAAFVGESVSMICVVSSTATPIAYQWQKGGIDLPGATNPTLTLSNVQLSDAGIYGLVATTAGGSATSRFSRLVVLVSQQNAITYATTRSSTGVTAGGIVNFDYFVTNVGTKTWGAHHYLSIRDVNNTFVAFSSLVGILPGETTTANLNFPAPTTPGSYTYYVQGLEDGVEFFSTQTTVVLTVLAPVTNAITYNTTSFPVSAAPGSNVIFTYNVTNTGTTTWGANHILSLKNGSGTVISSTPLTVLAPGASKTVNLSFTVPSTPGSYNYTVQASQTGVGNFGTQANLTLVALAPQPNAIVYNRVRYPDEVVPGAVLNLKYTLSNAGTQAWGAGHYVSLRDSAEAYLAFIPLSGTAAGATKTIEFTLTAPTTPGTYTYYVQALEDGIEFFSTQDVVIVKVVALPLGNAISYNTSTIPVAAAPGATVSFTANVTNRGTRTWGATHYLSFRDVDDTFLAFPSLSGVAPGASRTANLSFAAPTTPGIYTYTLQAFEDGVSFFKMADTVVLLVQ